ncbi:MAG: homoserine dehydrogenase [Pseudoxanthomonas sp.]
MSRVIRLATTYRVVPTPRLALLGTGLVGSAFVARFQTLQARGSALPEFTWLANSRALRHCNALPGVALDAARGSPLSLDPLQPWAEADALRRGDVVVDATASESVADWHAEWMARGVHVVTANKLGQGGVLARARDIDDAGRATGASYGDSATVGAGLPLLRSLRELVAGGDRIHRVEGVLSGSLAWLFDRYDGRRPFSDLVREARSLGFTEPDPRLDLSGEDVRRKLLILARAAGRALHQEQVEVESLVPPALAGLAAVDLDAQLHLLDAPLASRLGDAHRNGQKLCFLGRFDDRGAQVGLQALASDHPLCGGSGTDNRVAIFSDRYCQQPLLIQGPGAGAEITAAALLDDVMRIAATRSR